MAANPPQGSFPPQHTFTGAPGEQAVAANPPQGSFPPQHTFTGASEGLAATTIIDQGVPHPGRRGGRRIYVDAAEALAAAAIPDQETSTIFNSQGPHEASGHEYTPYSSGRQASARGPGAPGRNYARTAPADGRH